MKHLALLSVVALVGCASAPPTVVVDTTQNTGCYIRSSTVNDLKAKVQKQVDVQRDIVPINSRENRCIVTSRLLISGQWYTAQGQAQGDNTMDQNQLCARAMDTGRANVLQEIQGSEVSQRQDMVCTDQNIPQWRVVRVGDTVRESEVTPDPDSPASFAFKGMECKRFIETVPYGTGIIQNKGVICRMYNNSWKVYKKWENFRG